MQMEDQAQWIDPSHYRGYPLTNRLRPDDRPLQRHVTIRHIPQHGPLLPLQEGRSRNHYLGPVRRYAGAPGAVDSAVFQRTVDWPHEYALGYHAGFETGKVVTFRWDQRKALSNAPLED